MHGGQAMLKAMERSGIDYILSSPGSEWPPVWEALAEAAARGAQKPKYINCRHEAVAVAMAAGYTKVTRRPQVVMLHATAHGDTGFRITDPQEIKSAVEQALTHEAEGKLTVIDLVLSDLNPR